MEPAKDAKSTLKQKEEVLLTWSEVARPFKRRNRRFYITIFAMAGIVGLILFVAEGVMPVVLLISLVFLFYVMSTIEPERVEYKISNFGIGVGGKATPWELASRFWFTKRYDSELLVVEVAAVPGRLEFVIPIDIKEKVRESVSKFIPEETVPPSFVDRASDWVSKKLPQ